MDQGKACSKLSRAGVGCVARLQEQEDGWYVVRAHSEKVDCCCGMNRKCGMVASHAMRRAGHNMESCGNTLCAWDRTEI